MVFVRGNITVVSSLVCGYGVFVLVYTTSCADFILRVGASLSEVASRWCTLFSSGSIVHCSSMRGWELLKATLGVIIDFCKEQPSANRPVSWPAV